MTIDINKIRVGDKVTVEAVYAGNIGDGSLWLAFPANEGGVSGSMLNGWFMPAAIATHTPAPREFKRDDRVKWGDMQFTYEFIAARGDHGIILHVETGTAVHALLSQLRHADPAPAPQEAGKERKKIEAWVIFCSDGRTCTVTAREHADAWPRDDRIAFLHVVGYEGDGL